MIRRPRLYKIGLENVYFTKWVFWRWVFYAFWQSSLILFLAYYTLDSMSPDENGYFGGIWMGGEFVFGAVVIVSNMKIFISSYLISGMNIFLCFGSTLTYVLSFWLISHFSTGSQEFGTLKMIVEAPQTYFTVILFTFMFVLIDCGLQYLNFYIDKWFKLQKEKAIREKAKKAKSSKSVIKRKITASNTSKQATSFFNVLKCALIIYLFIFYFRSWIRLLVGGRK